MTNADNRLSSDINYIQNLDETKCKALKEETDKIIRAITERIHYAETRRSSFCVVAAALIAAGLALIPISLTIATLHIKTTALALAVGIIIVGILLFALYSLQTNYKYPFNQVTTTWKWFYRDALIGLSDISIPFTCCECENDKKNIASEITGSWPKFLEQYTDGILDYKESLFQDIQQVYVLHLNEKYKNKFLTNLRRLLNWGLILVGLAAVVAFFYAKSIEPAYVC